MIIIIIIILNAQIYYCIHKKKYATKGDRLPLLNVQSPRAPLNTCAYRSTTGIGGR